MSDDAKCVCGHLCSRHSVISRHDPTQTSGCMECSCRRYRPLKGVKPEPETVNKYQLAVDTTLRGVCGEAESVYERARKAVDARSWRPSACGLSDDSWDLIMAALDAGEKAERELDAIASVVCGNHYDGLSGTMVDGSTGCPWCRAAEYLVERDTAERERDALKARVKELESRVLPEIPARLPFVDPDLTEDPPKGEP